MIQFWACKLEFELFVTQWGPLRWAVALQEIFVV